MSDIISVGVIGCGNIGLKHIRSIHQHDHVMVKGICDIDINKLSLLQEEYDIEYTDNNIEDFLLHTDIDCFVICTPSGYHVSDLIKVAKSNRIVYCEKPLAITQAGIDLLYDGLSQGEILNSYVLFQHRLKPEIKRIKELIDANQLGKLLFCSGTCYWFRPQEYYDVSRRGTREMDGGVLLNQAIHFLDMLYFLSGKKIIKTQHLKATLAHEMECEDSIVLNIEFDDGSLGSLNAHTFSYPKNYEGAVILFFEHATIKIGGNAMDSITYIDGDEKIKEQLLANNDKEISNLISHPNQYRLYDELKKIVDIGKTNLPDVSEALHLAKHIVEIYDS